MNDGKLYFDKHLAAFLAAEVNARRLSEKIGTRFVSERTGWSQWLHLKLAISTDSLILICGADERIKAGAVCTLDQSSIISLARNMVEVAIMLAYVSEDGLSEAEWGARRTLICLHDATNRYRMFKGFKNKAEAKGFKEDIASLRAKLAGEEEFKKLDKERQEKLLSGEQVYLSGLRAAARLAGWDVDEFNAVYGYFSAHAHGNPLSFLRLGEHGVDFKVPTEAQYAAAGHALEIAGQALGFANKRIGELFREILLDVAMIDNRKPAGSPSPA